MIDSFSGEYRFLSNFWSSPVHYNGFLYPTVEHGFVSAKSLDPKFWEKVAYEPKPGKVKRLGREIVLRPDWEENKIQVMDSLLQQKFAIPELSQKLIDTAPHFLIEGNHWGDTFWGVDVNKGGKNMLGILLMNIRESKQAANPLFIY